MRITSFGFLAATVALLLLSVPAESSAQSTQPTAEEASSPAPPATDSVEASPDPAVEAAEVPAASAVPEGFDVLLRVEGMVCQFCASGIERLMNREDRVDAFEVDFDGGAVVVRIVDGETVSDEDFAQIIRRAGYSMVGLERAE